MNKNNAVTVASTKDMDHAIKLVADRFNLGVDYTLVEFKDGVNACKVTLASKEFKVTVEIKDKAKYLFPSIVGDSFKPVDEEEVEDQEDEEEDDEEEEE